MDTRPTAPARTLPLHPQQEVECRRCEVHCDKVVYPAACVERACPFVYAYEEFGRAVRRLHAEGLLGRDRLRHAAARRARARGFGAVKAVRAPLPMCEADVSSCYEAKGEALGCVNPEFFELPLDRPSFRVFARLAPSKRRSRPLVT